MAVETLPRSLTIVDCEKRRGVSRYYAYVIEVTRLNGEVYHIYRRYRKFHKMVQRLEERFPIEAGNIRASDRIIPQLPGQSVSQLLLVLLIYLFIFIYYAGKKYIGRSAVRDVAELRMPYLDEFLKVTRERERRGRQDGSGVFVILYKLATAYCITVGVMT